MKQYRLLQLAYREALKRWNRASEKVKILPRNEIVKRKEREAYEELNEIADSIKRIEEDKENE